MQITVFGQTSATQAQDVTSVVRFNPPLEIAFDITEAEWQAAGGDVSKFQVRFYSVQLGRWVQLSTEVDPFPPRRARASVNHLTTIGLFVEKPAPQPAATPTPKPIAGGDITVSTGALALLGLLGLMLIATGAYYLRGGRQRA
ncbi:MAG: hypothetical protein HY688_02495 [Chloroflexi bacterium]|nr:hypothetical protein [Chloroflexota bacterium]